MSYNIASSWNTGNYVCSLWPSVSNVLIHTYRSEGMGRDRQSMVYIAHINYAEREFDLRNTEEEDECFQRAIDRLYWGLFSVVT